MIASIVGGAVTWFVLDVILGVTVWVSFVAGGGVLMVGAFWRSVRERPARAVTHIAPIPAHRWARVSARTEDGPTHKRAILIMSAFGTAADSEVEDARTDALLAWGDHLWSPRRRSLGCWLRARRERRPWMHTPESAARYAINGTRSGREKTHAEVLAMVDELIEMGGSAASSRAFAGGHRPSSAIARCRPRE